MNTVWYDYSKVESKNGTAIALGNFDGLHKGHMKLLSMLTDLAQDNGLNAVAYTFDEHPVNVIKGAGTLQLIADNEYKEELLSSCGIDTLFFEKFADIRYLSPEEFVRDILVGKLNVKIAVVGLHNHYGKDSAGDVKMLRELGQKYGFLVHMIKPLYLEDEVLCSSTKIRELIANGDVETAATLLGRPFRIKKPVVQDKMLGRTMGYPTANMIPDTSYLLPQYAVYATTTYVDGEAYKSITNVGVSPTVGDGEVRVETHILGFDKDVYNETLEVEFLYKIRDQKTFGDLDELKAQLAEDEKARLAK
ncbi:MAG: bifunctional riboflavin kinase/FAD synthetase [Ruminococcaceae bacterium]|nr:bifunctional riboflavin kinase/FAD synthetase [Oscillospiraceae bacterium]